MAKSPAEEAEERKKYRLVAGRARIVYPEYISLKDWAGALMIDYPEVFLPILEDESKWEDWGSAVAGSSVFKASRVPSPYTVSEEGKKKNFKDWHEWAKAVYICVNGIKY